MSERCTMYIHVYTFECTYHVRTMYIHASVYTFIIDMSVPCMCMFLLFKNCMYHVCQLTYDSKVHGTYTIHTWYRHVCTRLWQVVRIQAAAAALSPGPGQVRKIVLFDRKNANIIWQEKYSAVIIWNNRTSVSWCSTWSSESRHCVSRSWFGGLSVSWF